MERPTVLFGLFLLCFGFHQILSLRIDPQSSMDAGYYFIIADRFAKGLGLTEPFVWQHLKSYTALVHPIDYWQPLGILIYSAILKVFPAKATIIFNHLIWAFLAVMIFRDTLRLSKDSTAAFISYLYFAVGGKYAFYVSTTDNIAIYALFGYFFFRALIFGTRFAAFQCGIISGLMALTRVEGLFFGGLAWLVMLKRKKYRDSLILLIVLALVVLPWAIRNQQMLGVLWPSSTKALFLEDYDEFFEPGLTRTPDTYLSKGFSWILSAKIFGLRRNVVDFFLIPCFLLFLPFWVAGFVERWNQGGKILLAFFLFFYLANSLIFTTQSIKGTAFHTVAAFIPYSAMLGSFGTLKVFRMIIRHPVPIGNLIMSLLLTLWVLGLTMVSVLGSIRNYSGDNQAYQDFLKANPIPPEKSIASGFPIAIHLLNGCSGLVLSPTKPDTAPDMARQYNCEYILYDERYHTASLPDIGSHGWRLVAASAPLVLWKAP